MLRDFSLFLGRASWFTDLPDHVAGAQSALRQDLARLHEESLGSLTEPMMIGRLLDASGQGHIQLTPEQKTDALRTLAIRFPEAPQTALQWEALHLDGLEPEALYPWFPGISKTIALYGEEHSVRYAQRIEKHLSIDRLLEALQSLSMGVYDSALGMRV